MKQRIGLILALTGAVLLLQPNMDCDVVMRNCMHMLKSYWPMLLILLGACLISPKKKKKRSTR